MTIAIVAAACVVLSAGVTFGPSVYCVGWPSFPFTRPLNPTASTRYCSRYPQAITAANAQPRNRASCAAHRRVARRP